jgi:hypothetical protein
MLHGNYGLISHFLGLGKEKSAYAIYFLLILVIVGGNPREEYARYTLHHCFISLLRF